MTLFSKIKFFSKMFIGAYLTYTALRLYGDVMAVAERLALGILFTKVIETVTPPPAYTPGYRGELERAWEYGTEIAQNIGMLEWLMIGLVLVMSFFIYYRGRRTIHRIRGIKYEAMMEGSAFTNGKPLPCQVAILIPGLIRDTHNGYGIRVEDFLVVPTHVISMSAEHVIAGSRGKAMVDTTIRFESKVHPDISYIPLQQTTWAMLGTPRAHFSTALDLFVEIYGPRGTSRGYLRRTNVMGQISYTGSTISGMSGSVYQADGKVCGMHTGYMEKSINVGVASQLIALEVSHLKMVRLEQSGLEEPPEDPKEWDMAQMSGHVADKYSTRREQELDYLPKHLRDKIREKPIEDEKLYKSGGLVWADMIDESAIKNTRRQVVQTQGKKPTSVDIPLMDMKIFERLDQTDINIEAARRTLMERIDAHEEAIFKLEEKINFLTNKVYEKLGVGKPDKYKCDKCTVECNTETALDNHVKSEHPQPERFPCEDCTQVFPKYGALVQHRIQNHTPKMFRCIFCTYEHKDRAEVVKHSEQHVPESVVFLENRKSSTPSSSPTSSTSHELTPSRRHHRSPYKSTTESLPKTKKGSKPSVKVSVNRPEVRKQS
nr:hypothetical protein 1 [Hubei tetragnatha maxillosa virus 6]